MTSLVPQTVLYGIKQNNLIGNETEKVDVAQIIRDFCPGKKFREFPANRLPSDSCNLPPH